MNTNLLKRTLLATVIATALTGCGSDGGFGYQLDAVDPVTMESTVNVTVSESINEGDANRFLTVGMLDGVMSQGVDLGENPGSILIQDTAAELTTMPADINVSFANDEIPIVVNGTNIVVDTFEFSDKINTGESATYSVSYWINNGFQFTCADMTQHPANCTDAERLANPNRRTVNITVTATPDPLVDIQLEEISVGLNETKPIDVILEPTFAADRDFIYEVLSGNTVVSVSTDGMITGLALGIAQIKVTSTVDSTITATADVEVTNPPKNVATFDITTPAGDALAANNILPDCTSFALVSSLTKIDDAVDFTGDFIYSISLDSNNVAVDGFTPNTGAMQAGFVNVVNLASTDTLTAELSGFGDASDQITTGFTTVENLACNMADDSPAGPNLLNEEFKVFWNGGGNSGDAFRVSPFIRNGDGADANLDPSAALSVVMSMGKNGSSALQLTADGTASSAIYSYHRNATRTLSAQLKPGGNFTISFWVKNNADAAVEVVNEVVNGDGRGGSAPVAGNFADAPVSETIEIPASSDWKFLQFDLDLTAVPGTQNGPKWEIIFMPSQTGGTGNAVDILLDDFSIALRP